MTRLSHAATQEAIRNLTDAVCDSVYNASFEALLERVVAEPDPAVREHLSEKLSTVAALWASSAADVAVGLCSQVADMGRTDVPSLVTCQPAGEPADAA